MDLHSFVLGAVSMAAYDLFKGCFSSAKRFKYCMRNPAKITHAELIKISVVLGVYSIDLINDYGVAVDSISAEEIIFHEQYKYRILKAEQAERLLTPSIY